jgi:hypothetical protein
VVGSCEVCVVQVGALCPERSRFTHSDENEAIMLCMEPLCVRMAQSASFTFSFTSIYLSIYLYLLKRHVILATTNKRNLKHAHRRKRTRTASIGMFLLIDGSAAYVFATYPTVPCACE